MDKKPDSFEKALIDSWKGFRDNLPGKMGEYLDPKVAYQKIIKNNGVAVLTELKESKEAMIQLWRLASGRHLSEEEMHKLKQQIGDLARTIPALGIFSLPGGMLLLPILAKSLPWNILPSAFRQELEESAPPPDKE
jgi:hypothetical protein